ncbi:hypothetical protein ACOME3_002365 [Neoechinorhynchus agilis]
MSLKSPLIPIPLKKSFDKVLNLTTGAEMDLRKENFFISNCFQTTDTKETIESTKVKIIADYPRVIFLGTGASCPSKFRNMSSILVEIDSKSSLLMDCGESTLMQLNRLYPGETLKRAVTNIKVIFVSHMHPDHHQALYGILELRQKIIDQMDNEDDGVLLFCPLKLQNVIRGAANVFGNSKKIFEKTNIILNKYAISDGLKDDIRERLLSLGILKFLPVTVDHIYDSCGLVFDIGSNQADDERSFRIVFSGDCRPSPNLSEKGINADLLIHEATLEDGMEDEAEIIKHCTVSEALSISKKMNARHTILTHFSQRYNKVVDINPKAGIPNDRIHIAFDHMVVPLKRLDELNSIKDKLREAFAQEFRLAEQRRSKSSTSAFLRKTTDI